ncbi:hypothetical protein KKG90_03430 [Candidatus Bipolaricaulota bacterium]|nr:hypothetical protein [Candidatus Bipolaricaulota bacterium]
MSNRLSLRELEKKAWLRTFEHGLWDIGIGSMFLTFGLSILADFAAFAGIWIVVLMPALRESGRRLVIPRIGHVQFRERRKRAKGRLTGVLTGTTVMGVLFFAFFMWLFRGDTPVWAQWIANHFVIFIGLIWGGALVITGKLVNFPRLYGYGVLVFGSLIITDSFAGYHLGISLSLVGGLILLIGIALLLRFMRRYPRHEAPSLGARDE